jgi:hypothetical protein
MIRTGTAKDRSATPIMQGDTKRCSGIQGAFNGSASGQHWVGRSDDIISGGIPLGGLSGGGSLMVGGRGPVRIRGMASATPRKKRFNSRDISAAGSQMLNKHVLGIPSYECGLKLCRTAGHIAGWWSTVVRRRYRRGSGGRRTSCNINSNSPSATCLLHPPIQIQI